MSDDILSLSFASNSTSFSSNSLISVSTPENTPVGHEEIFSIIGIGDSIVDVVSQVETDLIMKYGLKLGDSIFASEDSKEKNIELFNILESMPSVDYVPGGSVQNSIRVISWQLNNNESINRKKFKVSMLGALGNDNYRKKIENSLLGLDVNPILQILEGDKTSRCGVGVYKKEKLFVTQLRASKRLSEEFIEKHLDEILDHQAFLIEGYLLQSKFDIVKKLCNEFYKDNKLIILTLSAKFIVKCHYEKIIEMGNKADIIAGSMEEATELAGNKGDNNQEIFSNIFKKLSPKENRILVFTDGANGAFYAKYDYKNDKIDVINQVFPPSIKDEEIRDLNGAGDAFLGGFISEYMTGKSIYDCCKNGNKAASINLKNVGCTFPKKIKDEKK